MVKQVVCEKVEVMITCEVLGVSRSGYYAWLTKPEGVRELENIALVIEIKKIHDDSRETDGVSRVYEQLKIEGKNHGKGRVSRLMKLRDLSGFFKNKFKIKTTESTHGNPIADRILKTKDVTTHPTRPNQVWVTDVMYISTDQGFLFLGTDLHLFTRKIVGFSMADHMRTELLLDVLAMVLGRQKLNTSELLSHSDQGSQYASDAYRARLAELGITAGTSRRGNCYDNAFAETFFGTLKNELVYRTHFKTRQEAMTAIFEYIEISYNRKRIHSALGYLTPIA